MCGRPVAGFRPPPAAAAAAPGKKGAGMLVLSSRWPRGPERASVGQPFGGGAQASIVCGRPVFADCPASVCFTSSMQASMASGAPVNAMRLRLFVPSCQGSSRSAILTCVLP